MKNQTHILLERIRNNNKKIKENEDYHTVFWMNVL